jgi:chemotaxis protein MotB
MGKGKKCDCPEGLPAWLATFADLMSLLLTFFVLLLSFANMEEKKVREGIKSVQEALGVMPAELTAVRVFNVTSLPRSDTRTRERLRRIAAQLQQKMQVRGIDDDVNVKFTEKGGLKISLPSGILFDSASASLKTGAVPILEELVEPLKSLPEAIIETRGFTDDRPLRGSARFRDNWDLSYARAQIVAEHMQDLGNMPPEQFVIIGEGPKHPEASNDTPEGREENRRVELHITGDFTDPEQTNIEEMIRGLQPDATPASE